MMITRIYADRHGESHFSDIEVPLTLVVPAEGLSPNAHVATYCLDASSISCWTARLDRSRLAPGPRPTIRPFLGRSAGGRGE